MMPEADSVHAAARMNVAANKKLSDKINYKVLDDLFEATRGAAAGAHACIQKGTSMCVFGWGYSGRTHVTSLVADGRWRSVEHLCAAQLCLWELQDLMLDICCSTAAACTDCEHQHPHLHAFTMAGAAAALTAGRSSRGGSAGPDAGGDELGLFAATKAAEQQRRAAAESQEAARYRQQLEAETRRRGGSGLGFSLDMDQEAAAPAKAGGGRLAGLGGSGARPGGSRLGSLRR
jgi:hypothetical protein